MFKKRTTAEFIEEAVSIHGDVYDYSLTKYETQYKKVDIICKKHGVFSQEAKSHLRGSGCRLCSYEKGTGSSLPQYLPRSLSWFIERAESVHGIGTYDYSKSEYSGCQGEVEIICSIHGSFSQRATAHLQGSGCPDCGRVTAWEKNRRVHSLTRYYLTEKPSNLYVIRLSKEGEEFLKVGVSNNLGKRFSKIRRNTGCGLEVTTTVAGKANELYSLEQDLVNSESIEKYFPKESYEGSTELLEVSEIDKVLAIIDEFQKNQEGIEHYVD